MPCRTQSVYAFYALDVNIRKYDDLRLYNVGLINGHSYFKKIREDGVLTKSMVSRAEVLIKKLIKKQIEIAVINEDVGDYLINKMGLCTQIKKSTYKATERERAQKPDWDSQKMLCVRSC